MDSDNIYYVYEWIRLDTNEPFYVGKGKGDRWCRRNSRSKHFLNIYNKVETVVNILHENLSENEAHEYECWYINEYRFTYGYNLCNKTDGGDGVSGYKPSDEEVRRNRMQTHGFDIEDYKDEIIDMYLNNYMSTLEIAKYFKVSDVCVNRVLKKFKVKLRSSGSVKNKNRGLNRYNSKCVLVKDYNNIIIKYFESISLCGEWLASIGLFKNFHSGSKKVRQIINTNKLCNGFLFYNITRDEYNETINKLIS